MPKFSQTKVMDYSPKELFDIVIDIESYPKFLPWCNKAKILSKNQNNLIAELEVKFGFLKSSYISEVNFIPNQEINVKSISGPFKYLYNQWKFENKDAMCNLIFDIDFQFQSIIFERAINDIFYTTVKKMTKSFEDRAKTLYYK
jgi:coenzyme Q-binding protein COQ10